MPQGLSQIRAPTNSVPVVGRVLVESDSDLPAAHALARQIRLSPAGASS